MEASSEMQKEAIASTSEGLLKSPALLFITRKDLYSFLSSAGVSVCCVCMCVQVAVVVMSQMHMYMYVSLPPSLIPALSFQDAGEAFFANRALMELVQRIRSNPSLFVK